MEIWKPIVGYEGWYEVSSLGSVRGLARFVPHRSSKNGYAKRKAKIKSCRTFANGHIYVTLHKEGRATTLGVHVLVAEAFIGRPRDGTALDVCHKDGKPNNNKPRNLYFGTDKQNMADRDRHGRTARGEKHWCAKFTEKDIRKIKSLRGKMSQKDIGKMFGTYQGNISAIQLGKSWGHV